MAAIECAASPCTSIRGIFIGTLHDSWLAAITISSCGEGFPFSLSSNCNSNDIKRVQSGERIHGNEQASSTADHRMDRRAGAQRASARNAAQAASRQRSEEHTSELQSLMRT